MILSQDERLTVGVFDLGRVRFGSNAALRDSLHSFRLATWYAGPKGRDRPKPDLGTRSMRIKSVDGWRTIVLPSVHEIATSH
jgi:hypothetical protein